MQNLFAKTAGVVVAVALLVGVAVPSANALTSGELVELLISLGIIPSDQADAARTALGTTGSSSSSSCYAYTRDLTLGSTGADVIELQTMLEEAGYLTIPVGVSKGYFGSLTQSALASWQASVGISPAAGYFGPITRSYVDSMCVPTVPTIPGDDDDEDMDSDLQGGAGSVDDYEMDNSYNNEEVGEDEEDVEVAGIEIEVDDNSDLRILAVKLNFDAGTAGSGDSDDDSDDDLDEYADEVSIWYKGDEVARVDADEFDDDGSDPYQSTVTLDEDVVIEAGDTETLVVAITGISNLDSDNQGKTWTVDFSQVRWEDAQGTVISEDPSTDTETFSFESFASAVDLEVNFDEDDDSVNEAHVIDIDDSNDTDDEPLLSFEIEVEGVSSINMDDLPVTVTSTGGNIDDIVSAFALVYDGDDVGSENSSSLTSTTGTLTFDDLDLDLDEGTHTFLVTADILATTTDGNTISVDITSDNAEAADIEDELGEDVASGDVNGSADGEAHALYDDGIMVDFVSKDNTKIFTADESGEKDRVEFEFTFDVTAFGADMFIDKDTFASSSPSAGGDGIAYATTSQSSGTSTISSAALGADSTDTNDTDYAYIIDENSTRELTLSVVVEAGQDGQVQVKTTGIAWGTAGADDDDATTNMYTFNLDEFLSKIVTTNIQ